MHSEQSIDNNLEDISQKPTNDVFPLCVDLDNTLINTDLLHEGFLQLLKTSPFKAIYFIYLLSKNKAIAKEYLAHAVQLNLELIPINTEVYEYCSSAAKSGQPVYLVTGTHLKTATLISKRFSFVNEIYATSNNINLVGRSKEKLLVKLIGKKKFDYIGDSHHDVHVWKSARNALSVGNSSFSTKPITNHFKHFLVQKNSLKTLIKSLRPQQWVKNGLVLLPIFLAHQIYDSTTWIKGFLSVISFSLIASSVYLMNDLTDLENDRYHPKKRRRPLAAGDISVLYGLIAFLICFSAAVSISSFLGLNSLILVLIYFLLNIGYSFSWKRIPVLDVFLLTAFYLIRISFGATTTQIEISPWMRAFSFFLFLSLGFLKRYSEVFFTFQREGNVSIKGRGYSAQDLQPLFTFGTLSSFLAALVFSQYIFQSQNEQLYRHMDWLWGAAVIILFWLCSLWLRASKGKVNDDPVVFVIKDPLSRLLGIIFLVFVLIAI